MRSTFFRRWSVAARAFLIKATRLSTLRAIGVGSLFYRRLHRKIISEDTSMFSVAGWPLWGLIILFAVGLVLIIKGGDFFVDAASWIAEVSGIPHFIVGATIVSIATTLPELIVSCLGAARGTNALAIGNAVGSVTANTGLIWRSPSSVFPPSSSAVNTLSNPFCCSSLRRFSISPLSETAFLFGEVFFC